MSLRWLTADGVVAAMLVGALVFRGAGLSGLALLGLFFVSGSLLTAWNLRERPPRPQDAQGDLANGSGSALRPGRALRPLRNGRQVIANGGWAAAGAILIFWRPDLGWAALLGSLATAQADTWASEIGLHARHPPRLITTGRPVPPGTSGGISLLGTVAGALGAMVMAGVGRALGVPLSTTVVAVAVGVLGMLTDSWLGATLEAQGRLDNDGVNLAATSVGAVGATALTRLVGS